MGSMAVTRPVSGQDSWSWGAMPSQGLTPPLGTTGAITFARRSVASPASAFGRSALSGNRSSNPSSGSSP
jgi:hypothetical protein